MRMAAISLLVGVLFCLAGCGGDSSSKIEKPKQFAPPMQKNAMKPSGAPAINTPPPTGAGGIAH
jgi:hypothetical protein